MNVLVRPVQRPTKYSPNATPNMRPAMLSTGKWTPAMTRLVVIRAADAVKLVDHPLECAARASSCSNCLST